MQITLLLFLLFNITITVSSAWKRLSEITTDEFSVEELYLVGKQPVYADDSGSGEVAGYQQDIKEYTGVVLKSGFELNELLANSSRPQADQNISSDDDEDEREFSGEDQDFAVWDQWICKEENEYCYYLSTQIKTWIDAHQDCLQLGGMLPFWIKTAKPHSTLFDGLAMWSSLHWYNGRLHEFDESWNSPKIKDFSEMDESLLRYVAEQKHCFAIGDSAVARASDNVWDLIITPESELHLEGYSCNRSLPYFCIARSESLNKTQEVLRLPLETAVDVRLEKISTNNGTESLQCTSEFQTQNTNGKRRPFTIVWIVDHMYYPHIGYNGFNGVNILTVPYENFTNYACEVRYLGSAYGNLSREIDVPLLSTPKLALVLRIKNPLSPNTSLDYSQQILETLASHNSNSNIFTLTTTEPSFFDGFKLEFVSITYVLVNFLNDESHNSYRSLVMQCSSKTTTNTSSQPCSEQQKFPFSSLESYFGETLRQETVSTELLLVDRCNVQDITEELVWIGLAGQEVIPSARKPASQSCVDVFGNPVTRSCEGSLISGAKWVEPFSIEKNCSKMEKISMPAFCPVGYTKRETDSKQYCVKQVLPQTWNDAMAACFGGHLKHPYYSNNDSDATFWIVNILDFIRASNGTSSQSTEDMLWLPSKRRVPGGPLYPYSINPSYWNEELSKENSWQSISSSEYVFNRTNTSTERETPVLDYRHLNADKQCLAWSIKEQMLTTRSCSEQHPTICIKKPTYANGAMNVNSLSPDYYSLAECRSFSIFTPNEFGINSCYEILEAKQNSDVSQTGMGFTWEEALLACQRKHLNATLAVTASNLRAFLLENILKEKAFYGDAWLGVRQSRSGVRKNNHCRFFTANEECVRQPYGIDSKTDFRHGVDASISRSVFGGNEDFFQTFQLPQRRLPTAICQLDFNPSHRTKITYRLMLEWLNSTNYFRIFLNYDGIPGRPFRVMNWNAVKRNMVCFQDGKFRRVGNFKDWPENEMEQETFPISATTVFCESMGVDSILLRSNTLVTRQSEFLFAITVIDKNVTIVKQSSANSTAKLHGNTTYPKQGFDHPTYALTQLEYAKQFEPSAAQDSQFETSVQSYNDTFQSIFNHSEDTGNYVLSNVEFGRISTNLSDEENLLVRYHVIFLEKEHDTKLSQEKAYLLVYGKVKSAFSTIPNAVFETLKSKTFCLEERVLMTGRQEEMSFQALTWPETELNRTVYSREGCFIEGSSLVQRTCEGDIYHGTEWGSPQAWNREGKLEVLQRNFVCSEPSRTTSQLINMTQIRENPTSALAELQDVTNEWQPSMVDIQLTALIFSSASNEETSFSETDIDRVENIITQVSTIETETLASAQNLPNVATNFLTGLEDTLTRADSINSTLNTPTLQGRITAFKTSSSLLFAGNSTHLGQSDDKVSNTSITRNPNSSMTAEHDAAVFLKSSSLASLKKENATIAFIFHPNVRLVDSAAAEGKKAARVFSPNPSDGDGELLSPKNYTPNSVLIQVGIKGGSVKLAEPISIYFRPFHKANSSNSSSVVCVFWNPDSNAGGGGWSTEGCWYVSNENGSDHCQCNHLSAFTTLFAYDYESNEGIHMILLDLLTTIGCSLSLLGLIGVIATYILFPHWRKPDRGSWGNHIIFNLSVALATLLAVFIAGFDQTEDATICLLVAIVLHYSMLAVFCWMLVEAYTHYLRYVKVFDTYIPRFMLKASLFAWITPLIPVILLLVVKIDYYYYTDNNNYCWLTPEGFYIALLPFVAAVTLINVITYVRIIINVTCSKSTLQSNQNQAALTLRHVHMAMATFVLLGLSWIFGLLAIGRVRTIFSYLFCTFNSMQGFAIFWLFIFKEKRARDSWANFLRGISHRDLARQRNRLMVQAGASNDTSTVSRSKTTGTNVGTQDSRTNASNSHDTSTVSRSRTKGTPNSYELYYM